MNYARVCVAVLDDDVEAASGEDPKTCPKFEATLKIFNKFSSPYPENGSLQKITGEVIKGFNRNEDTYAKGEEVIVAQLIDETWIIVDSAGGGQTILFEILQGEYVNEAESNDCDDKLRDAKEKYLAKVIGFPCGQSSVYGMDANGNVEVQDYLGSFLQGREEAEVLGKQGVAVLIQPEDDYECIWVITWIDWFREIQVITNVIVTSTAIKFEVKNVQVWDDCDLPPIEIPLVECPEGY